LDDRPHKLHRLLPAQNEEEGKLWSSRTYFKIQIVSFIAVLTTAAVTGRLGFLCKNAAALRNMTNGTPVLSRHWGLKKTTINLQQEAPQVTA
jgi:hypothetical protein